MKSGVKTKRLRIGGMTCINCQNKIERKLQNTAGIQSAKVSYSAGTAAITYDTDIISLKDICGIIGELDYTVLTGNEQQEPSISRVVGFLVIIVSLYILLQQFDALNQLVPSQLADTKMGYGMLFVIGLITSIHCIAMCGGINLSQCIPHKDAPLEKKSRFSTLFPAFLYNLGRVISYTVIGFVLGFTGLLFGGGSGSGLPVMAQGVLKLLAGVFMVIMGINMLGLFPWLRRLQPRMPRIFARKMNKEKVESKSPFIVGLLNGLMPCGPLQSMQIVALASGNPLVGGLSMLLFSLGTVPLMLGLGSIVSAFGRKFAQKVINVGAVLVVVLGLAMLAQGGSLSGLLPPDRLLPVILVFCVGGVVSGIPFRKPSHRIVSTVAALGTVVLVLLSWDSWNSAFKGDTGNTASDSGIQIVNGKQVVNSKLSSGRYPNITVQAGTPVQWVIDAPQGTINGCNNRMLIRDYGIEYSFKTGENVIEFTPAKAGKIQYNCWMGMIRGTITVTEAGSFTENATYSASDGNAAANGPALGASAAAPVPSGYAIPTDTVEAAKESKDEYGEVVQKITIELTDQGFSPAVVVVQSGADVRWNIVNTASGAENGTQLLVPAYATQLPLEKGQNLISFFPTGSFDFSTGDAAFYGYVKVVDDINRMDVGAIKEEVGKFETLIWPPETFQATGGGGASCH